MLKVTVVHIEHLSDVVSHTRAATAISRNKIIFISYTDDPVTEMTIRTEIERFNLLHRHAYDILLIDKLSAIQTLKKNKYDMEHYIGTKPHHLTTTKKNRDSDKPAHKDYAIVNRDICPKCECIIHENTSPCHSKGFYATVMEAENNRQEYTVDNHTVTIINTDSKCRIC